ncbi:hypothetical protein B4U80_06438 [Leptotrombidium deliense]|uniref:Uncharacterized protein n=1 Tax=Leptotrombidium deliense TaxID=299467 RepID=A0A443RYM8_9ACAR|nr:hypothetical protein B4U80_06438 [Leptotrombidium deliense]
MALMLFHAAKIASLDVCAKTDTFLRERNVFLRVNVEDVKENTTTKPKLIKMDTF